MNGRMFVYPWDLRDEGVEPVCDRLREAGITSLAITTSYHAGKFLRPHAPSGKIWYPEDGTVYFRADPSRYGRLQPQVAQLAESFDAIGELANTAPELARAGWTVGLHNSRLGKAFPELTCQTVFGDSIRSALCPAQPEVQDYIAALCLDQATNHPVNEISIETPGYQTFRHNDHHEFELIEVTPRAASLLGICFCEACLTAAEADGIPARKLSARAASELELFFREGTEAAINLDDDPDWTAFIDWRCGIVARLVARIRSELPDNITLSVIPTVRTPLSDCWREGANLSKLAKAADRLAIPVYCSGVEATVREMKTARTEAGPDADISFILRPGWPTLNGPDELEAAIAAAETFDTELVEFYNYGHMRLRSLEWIGKQMH